MKREDGQTEGLGVGLRPGPRGSTRGRPQAKQSPSLIPPSCFSLLALATLVLLVPTAAHAEEHTVTDGVDTKNLTTLPTTDGSKPPPSPDEPPPIEPHKRGVVVQSSLGAMGFVGQFRKVAPPAPWLKLQAGYEPIKYVLLFGEGDLFFTDTSNLQDPPKTKAFAAFGFGGGVRGTLPITEHFSIFLEGDVGLTKADIAKSSLANIGFKNAESLNPYFGGHLGVEWYQIDRHLAIGLAGGVRDLTGFKKTIGVSDTPLTWDGALSLRYTF